MCNCITRNLVIASDTKRKNKSKINGKMRGSKEILEEMQLGDEYVNALMGIHVYNQIEESLQEQMSITIRQKNNLYESDDMYRDLTTKARRANKILRDYEFHATHD